MPAHIFVSDRKNFDICMRRGVVGIPSASPESRNRDATNDALISRMCVVKENDYLLFYIAKEHALYGIWQAEGTPFYDETEVWADRSYPYRVRFKNSPYSYDVPLKLHDLLDLQNEGKLWNFILKRASGSNAMFSISENEFLVLLNEYSKINPYTPGRRQILEPYPVRDSGLLEKIHLDCSGQLKYEAGLMAYLLSDLTLGRHRALFGNYTDYLCYAPTNIGSEMDILLMFANPLQPGLISSYEILELKRDLFDEEALAQLIGYESWFLQKKVFGDQKMIRATAIAQRFSPKVIEYVHMRSRIERKPIKLVRYALDADGQLMLEPLP